MSKRKWRRENWIGGKHSILVFDYLISLFCIGLSKLAYLNIAFFIWMIRSFENDITKNNIFVWEECSNFSWEIVIHQAMLKATRNSALTIEFNCLINVAHYVFMVTWWVHSLNVVSMSTNKSNVDVLFGYEFKLFLTREY